MRLIHEYDATTEMGIPVSLIDTVVEHDDGGIEIPNLDLLLATAAVARVLMPVQLVGSELRFLRHVLHFSGTEFANEIGLSDKAVVSRWENDKVRAGGYTEKVIRQLVLNLLGDRATGIEIERNAIPGMRIRLRGTSEGAVPMEFSYVKRAAPKGGTPGRYRKAA